MTEWQAANLPDSLPLHIRRNIDEGICRADYEKAIKAGEPWESRRPWSVKEVA